MMTARIDLENGSLVLRTPYNQSLVQNLKYSVPASERTYDPARKVWIVDPKHGATLQDLCAQYLNVQVNLPTIQKATAKPEQRILEVRYIGASKDRNGEKSAFGWSKGGWTVILPEQVLRDWFEDDTTSRPGAETTLFGVLGIKSGVSADEIKTAYRRMAKQWHPDVCKEADAKEQFLKIQAAYEILSDGIKRAKYEAGLKLQASMEATPGRFTKGVMGDSNDYRSPLRCGLIIATGIEKLGRFVVSKIDMWSDITDNRGRVLVTSWPVGSDNFIETWS